MGRVRRRVFRIGFALAALACTGREPNAPTLTSRIDDVSLAGLTFPPGVSEHEVTVNGESRRFAIWAPPEGVGSHNPVILFLHGAQRRPSFRHWLGRCFIQPELASLSPIVIAPHAPRGLGGEWWRGEEASFALGLLRSAVYDLPVDDRRVVVMGYSNGGIGAWVFARAYPQYFSAAIPMAFNHTVVGETPLPVFAIQGERDAFFGSAEIVEAVRALQSRGYPVSLRVRRRGTHIRACEYHEQLAQARDWLTGVVWADLPPAPSKSSSPAAVARPRREPSAGRGRKKSP